MKQLLFKTFMAAAWAAMAGIAALANEPGGGTNGPDVTLTDNGSSITLANGIVTATIDKDSGKVTSMYYGGKQVVQSGGNIYYSMDGDDGYRTTSNCSYVIKTNTADMVDVSFRQTWNSSLPYAFDIEAHWVLRRGNSGLYAYALLDHPANYPSTTNVEWRLVWKFPNDVLERVYVDELRHWQMPSSADIAAAEPTSIAEIVKLVTGVRAGHYDSKYEYSAEYENIGTWGHASSVNNIGAWMVTGNYEYFNDGPTKQDLTLAWDYNLIHFGRNHYTLNDSSVTYALTNVAWQKIYGPFLLYLNTNSLGGDALWADAKAQVQAEHNAWPYAWLTGNTSYPLADARGAVSGRFLATDALKPFVSTSNAWVGLTDPSVNWQFDQTHYQYWVRAAADGSFSIQNIRPGTYTLHAFTDGEMGEYSLNNVVVTAGTTNALGDLTWNVPRSGNYLLWEIGVPNRTATDYRHGTNDYYEGFIWDTFASEFPNPLEYNIGAGDWSKDLNYVHNSYKVNGVRYPWKWRLNFLMSSVPASGNAKLNFAFASVHNASLDVYINNESSVFTTISPASPPAGGNALVREGIHAKYITQSVSVPVANLHVGTNTISLVMTSTGSDQNHFMYDAINLELPSRPPVPAGFDLVWNGGLASNVWDLATANWSSNSVARTFANGNKVLFDDTGLNNPEIRLTNTLSPGSVALYAMKSFSFTGNGSLSGAMTLTKSGPGTLTINNTNTYTGSTIITNGSLIVNGSLNSSPVTLQSGTLAGGTGKFGGGLTAQAGSYVQPGFVSAGTLIASNALVESGRVTNIFDLSDDVTGTTKTNDLIKVFGNLTLAGTNTVVINPTDGILADGIYPLIQYSGSLTGGTTNFVVRGVVGKPFALTNVSGTIALFVISNRSPTDVVWHGGLAANIWDQAGTSNWLNGAALDVFAFDDTVLFDNSGSTSPAVNLSGDLTPSSVTVNASVNYTFAGSGSIVGDGGLTKLNSGTLTVLATNEYTGPTVIGGGVLAVNQLADGGSPSAIGAATFDSTNLVFQSNATLRYSGITAISDHGATFDTGGGKMEVTSSGATLTLAGGVTGVGGLTKLGSGTLSLSGTNDYSGGTLISEGTLQMGAGADSGTLGTGDITNDSQLVFSRSDVVTVTQTISGSGMVVKSGGGTVILAGANTYTGGTTNSQGSLLLADNNAIGSGAMNFVGTSGSVQLADGVVVTNDWMIVGSDRDGMLDCPEGVGTWAGNIYRSGGSFRPGTTGSGTLVLSGIANLGSGNFIVPNGNVTVAGNGVLSASGSVCALGRGSSGSGTLFVVKDNAQLTFSSGLMLGQTKVGTVYPIVCTIQDNAVLSTATANFDLHNGSSTGSTNTLLNLDGGMLFTGGLVKTQTASGRNSTIRFNGGTLKALAANSSFLNALAGLTASVSAGGAVVDDGGFSITIAAPLVHDSLLSGTTDGGLTKRGSGFLFIAGANTYTGPTTILEGRLDPVPGGVVPGDVQVGRNGTFSVANANGAGSFTLGSGHSLSGDGALIGHFTIGSGAVLAPGSNSIGALTWTLSSSLTLAAGSTNYFEISHSPMGNDAAIISGALTNGGTLIVSNAGTSELAAGDSFQLFQATSYHGGFARVILPSLGYGLAWDTNALSTSGTISVTTKLVDPPVIGGIAYSGGNLVFVSTGGVYGSTAYLLSATNLFTPMSNWMRLETNYFDVSGKIHFTNGAPASSSQEFFRVFVP